MVNPANGTGNGMFIFTVGPNSRDGARQDGDQQECKQKVFTAAHAIIFQHFA